MWSGIYTLLIILVGLIILLVVVISALKDELCEAKTALEESEKRFESLERTAFCALHNVVAAEDELSAIKLSARIMPKVGGFKASLDYHSLDRYLARASSQLSTLAYYKTHF